MVNFAGVEHVQRGYRPAVVISNDKINRYSPNVIVIPLTTAKKKLSLPTHVLLDAAKNGLHRESVALCENPMTISKAELKRYCTHLNNYALRKIIVALFAAISASVYLDEDSIFVSRWNKTA